MKKDSKFGYNDFEINRILKKDDYDFSSYDQVDEETKENIMRLYVKGYSSKEISSRLNINISIVEEVINKNCFCSSL